MQTKSEAKVLLQNFVTLVETQFDKKIKQIRSYNGLEFQLDQFYTAKGILH